MGIRMVAHAIIAFGTEAQKEFFLPRILSGEVFFCQGYSEPEAGSDLAALSMAAFDDGDDLVCTGSKIWTTHAGEANWMFGLVRTSRTQKKQQGITFVLIDMTSPGIQIRPLVMTSGEEIQNQVFFDEVRVPKSNVLGQIDDGWTVAKYLLEFERGGGAAAPALQVMAEEIATVAASQPALLDCCGELAVLRPTRCWRRSSRERLLWRWQPGNRTLVIIGRTSRRSPNTTAMRGCCGDRKSSS
jgi:alkylation response protein AidB-like acyl-CoA dehydrogenase